MVKNTKTGETIMIPADINMPTLYFFKAIADTIGVPLEKLSLFFKNVQMTNFTLPLSHYGITWNTPTGQISFSYVGYGDIVKCQRHDGSWDHDLF